MVTIKVLCSEEQHVAFQNINQQVLRKADGSNEVTLVWNFLAKRKKGEKKPGYPSIQTRSCFANPD
jgi:hypothetical protein